MASVNKVILVGNVGRDPDIRATDSTTIASFSLATTRRFNNREGQLTDETEWHRVVFFGRTADVVKNYVKKGSPLYVEGRLRTRKYMDQNQQERYITEIVGEVLQLLGRRGEDNSDAVESYGAAPSEPSYSAPAPKPAAAPMPAPRPTPAPAPMAPAGVDSLEDDDVPF